MKLLLDRDTLKPINSHQGDRMSIFRKSSELTSKFPLLRVFALVLVIASGHNLVSAQTTEKMVTLESRQGTKISYWWMPNQNAKATVLLLSGGEGGMGYKDGQPRNGNFLIRSRDLFFRNDMNVAILGNPTDKPRLDHQWRVSAQHAQDVSAVIDSLKVNSNVPLWLVGTSNGTISATALGIALPDKVQGLVLTASVLTWKIPQAVPRQDVGKISAPVLFYHHKEDSCAGTLAYELPGTVDRFTNSKQKKMMIVTGGENPQGDPCQAFHWHGFIGMETQAVNDIAAWIFSQQP
ncbi:alpha/beta hydrolase [Limnohabitans sp. WS1]|uniref:alpha/beta hydrolase n=1 Tax=Limnohabitans sp. WS1 TaxID=1100726 RepID=UPI0011B22C78|nr:alpha/beta hydrolase [Limnohabitans sp. WS1]